MNIFILLKKKKKLCEIQKMNVSTKTTVLTVLKYLVDNE